MKFVNLMKSRKAWLTAIPLVVIVAKEVFGMEIDPESLYALVGAVAALIAGIAYEDGNRPWSFSVGEDDNEGEE